MNERFWRFASRIADLSGSSTAFFIALIFCIGWIISGPIFRFSDKWQLVINSVSSVATLLMVFLLQNSQNRDTMATQIKLDELIRAIEGTRKSVIGVEEESEEELEEHREQLLRVKKNHRGKKKSS